MSDETEYITIIPGKPTVADLTQEESSEKLWEIGLISWKLHSAQLDIYEKLNNYKGKIFVINCSRQLGKCRAKTDTCLTPNGPVQMQHIKPGDKVYGYNADGSVSLTTVLASASTGEKEVIDFIHNGKVIETSSKDHRWLTRAVSGSKWQHLKNKLRTPDKMYKGTAVARQFYDIPCGDVHEPHAYAIGALLGDGCSRETSNTISISSENNIIPSKVGNILGVEFVTRNSASNYTWKLSHVQKRTGSGYSVKAPTVYCSHYDEWCKGKYAHEKTADWDVINTWDRESCLNFLAGIMDTDGNVIVTNNILILQLGMQAKPVIDVVEKLIYKLWQYKAPRSIDKRAKYKNGPVYQVKISSNLFSKRALRELSPYLVTDRKKWKEAYKDCLEHNSNPGYVGVKLSAPYKTECWDIQVDSETSLYLTGNGLVTHNSYMLCAYAIEFALQHKDCKIAYLAPTAKMVKKIILPRMTEILTDCPRGIKPIYKINEQIYRFKNGSEIHISGTDSERSENLRGQVFHLVICDEAGFMDRLDYTVSSILVPTTTHTRGKIILSSTPPLSNDHPFKTFADLADLKKDGSYVKKTIKDNKLLNEDDIAVLCKEAGGEKAVAWRREYLAEFIVDTTEAVIPEATEEKLAEITKEVLNVDSGVQPLPHQYPIPLFYDAYTVADLGYTDNTGILFGYWDYVNAKLVIQDEALFNKPNTKMISDIVKTKEIMLWGNKKPYMRFCDGDLIAISDLNNTHDLQFAVTRNDDLEASVNACRLFIDQGKIIIDSRCVNLQKQLQNALWDSSRKKFKRSAAHGHFDLLAALIYMIRNVRRQRNPFPPGLGLDIATMFVPQDKEESRNHQNMVKALNLTKPIFDKADKGPFNK